MSTVTARHTSSPPVRSPSLYALSSYTGNHRLGILTPTHVTSCDALGRWRCSPWNWPETARAARQSLRAREPVELPGMARSLSARTSDLQSAGSAATPALRRQQPRSYKPQACGSASRSAVGVLGHAPGPQLTRPSYERNRVIGHPQGEGVITKTRTITVPPPL